MVTIGDMVIDHDLNKMFKILHIKDNIAYGFNIVNNDVYIQEHINNLIPLNKGQKVIKYLINADTNKWILTKHLVGKRDAEIAKFEYIIDRQELKEQPNNSNT
ncbi:hypothetical protein CCP3SC1AL1_2280003 [Gammaproteobacteria bacterium]